MISEPLWKAYCSARPDAIFTPTMRLIYSMAVSHDRLPARPRTVAILRGKSSSAVGISARYKARPDDRSGDRLPIGPPRPRFSGSFSRVDGCPRVVARMLNAGRREPPALGTGHRDKSIEGHSLDLFAQKGTTRSAAGSSARGLEVTEDPLRRKSRNIRKKQISLGVTKSWNPKKGAYEGIRRRYRT